MLGRAAHKPRNQRKGDRAHHPRDRGHKRIAHARNQRHDRLLHRLGVGHVKPGKPRRQADQRSQKAQRYHQPGDRLGKGDPTRPVDGRVLVDVIFDVGGVVVYAVGEKQVVEVLAPVRIQAALAQELVLLPGSLARRPLLDQANRAPDGRARARDRRDAPRDPHHKQKEDHRVYQRVDHPVGRADKPIDDAHGPLPYR